MSLFRKIFSTVLLSIFVFCLFFSCEKKENNVDIDKYVEINNLSRSEDSVLTDSDVITDYVIKLGFSTNMNDPRAEASLLFKTLVEDGTDGRIKVELFSDGLLGSDSQLISKIINSEVDMTISSAGNYASYVTIAGYSAMPFLFSNFEEAWSFLDGNKSKKINKAFESYNMVVLGYFDNGFRCVTTSAEVGPIKSVENMNGLVIRTSQNQIVMETMYALNAIPKSYPFGGLRDALRERKFSAQENPIPIIYNNKLYEEQKYLAITNHSYDAMPFTIRKNLWDRFSKEDMEVIKNAAIKAQALNRKIVSSQTKNYIKELEKVGMVITYPDLAEFKKATQEVFEVFAPVYGKDILQ